MARFISPFVAFCSLPLALGGCSTTAQQSAFLMPDGQNAAIVSLSGDGTTPPVVALITPKASPYNVQLVSATPVVQSALQGAVAGVAIGGGLAAQGALIRPDRISTSNTASSQGSSATAAGGTAFGGSATGGTGTGGSACIGPC